MIYRKWGSHPVLSDTINPVFPSDIFNAMCVMFKSRESDIKFLHRFQVLKRWVVLVPCSFTRGEERDTGRIGEYSGCCDPVGCFQERYLFNLSPNQLLVHFSEPDCRFREKRERLPKQFTHPVVFFECMHLVGEAPQRHPPVAVRVGADQVREDLLKGGLFVIKTFELEELGDEGPPLPFCIAYREEEEDAIVTGLFINNSPGVQEFYYDCSGYSPCFRVYRPHSPRAS